MADSTFKVVTLGDQQVLVATVENEIDPDKSYDVEITIREANAGPGAAWCGAKGNCGDKSSLVAR